MRILQRYYKEMTYQKSSPLLEHISNFFFYNSLFKYFIFDMHLCRKFSEHRFSMDTFGSTNQTMHIISERNLSFVISN